MPGLRLSKKECQSRELPLVCIVCGEPAQEFLFKKFYWIPGLALLGLLAGCFPFLIVLLIALQIRKTYLPYCDRHQTYWKEKRRVLWYAFIPVALCFVVAMTYDSLVAAPAERGGAMSWLICAGSTGLFVLWTVFAAIRGMNSIRPTQIDKWDIRLVGIHANFIASVRDQRTERQKRKRQERASDEAIDPMDDHSVKE
jgi:hypothetical protein